jgi:hypothetical protein
MDHLPMPKITGVRQAIESAGARLICQPPYSPDLNPDRIELQQTEGAFTEGNGAHSSLVAQIGRIAKVSLRELQEFPTPCRHVQS